MYGSSVLEVPDHGDGQVLDGPNLAPNGEEIKKCLGWMFTDSIPSIDQGLGEELGAHGHSAGLRVS